MNRHGGAKLIFDTWQRKVRQDGTLAWQQRQAQSFTVSCLYAGYGGPGDQPGLFLHVEQQYLAKPPE